MRILVTGKNGQLGQSIKNIVDNKGIENLNNFAFIFVGRDELDFTDLESIKSFLHNNNFDVIVNCAAYTQVDKAEANEKEANTVNHLAVKELAKKIKQKNISLIHISTDYVFDGFKSKPYNESDATSPLNIYGKTKLDGENAVLSLMKSNAIIIRTGWVFSEFGNNFVKKILSLAKNNSSLNIVSDQIGSPTYANDLAKTILTIISSNKFIGNEKLSEIYHYSNQGQCSWQAFAEEIVKIVEIDCNVNQINTEDYPLPAKRPNYSVLDKQKISYEYDLKINNWKNSLKTCLKNL
jgi:dTDP-4-dehydrorhamnose reductase